MDKQAALIHYYAREGFHHQVQTVCNEFLKVTLLFSMAMYSSNLSSFKSCVLAMEGSGMGSKHNSSSMNLSLSCTDSLQ